MPVGAVAPCVEHSTVVSVPLELNVGFRIDSTLNTVPRDLLGRVITPRVARGSALVLLLFAASAVAGLIGPLAPRAAALAVLSGILFGGAMIAVGEHVLRSLRRRRHQQSTRA